jgi:hypothetical protein
MAKQFLDLKEPYALHDKFGSEMVPQIVEPKAF